MAKRTDQAKRQRLSQMLIEFLGRKDWNAARLAEEIDLAAPGVRSYIQGTAFPEEDNRRKIATVMGLTYEELQAKLDGVPLGRRLSADELCREIRQLERSELRVVARVLFDRLLEEDEAIAPPNSK
jgi:hypothetical protein